MATVGADEKVTDFPTAGTLSTADIMYLVQSGADYHVTLGALLTFFGGGGGAGAGTVSSVTVATANGFGGNVSNPTTTPSISIKTGVIGLLKGNGTAVSAATPGTDYLSTNQTITLSGDVSGSGATAITATLVPVGTAGTFTKVTTDTKGRVTSGTGLVPGDVANLDTSKITSGTFPVARIGTGTAASGQYVDGGTGAWTTLPGAGGPGSVTSVSVVSANGFGGTVATATTTPAITITTGVSGIIKGTGTGLVAAVADTDFLLPSTASINYQANNTNQTDLAGLGPTKGRLAAGNGTNWVALAAGTNGQVMQAD